MSAAAVNQILMLGVLFQSGMLVGRNRQLDRAVGFVILTLYFSLCIALQFRDGATGLWIVATSSSFIVWGFLFETNRAVASLLSALHLALYCAFYFTNTFTSFV